MKEFNITCSSTCDLTKEYLKNNNNLYVNFYYYLDDLKFKDDFYTNISIDDFYNEIKTKKAKTSQPDPEQYIYMWEQCAKENKDIIHIELSSGISGAYNTAMIAKDLFLENHHEVKIYVIDSLCASAGYGLLVHLENKYKKEIDDIEKCAKLIEDIKLKINHVFCTADLTQLFNGGRLSRASFTIGKFLKIVPVLHVNKEGKLEVIEKTRGINNAIKKIVEIIEKSAINGFEYDEELFISHSYCRDIVDIFINEIRIKFKNLLINNDCIYNIGTVIGSHTGQGTITIFYIGDDRI